MLEDREVTPCAKFRHLLRKVGIVTADRRSISRCRARKGTKDDENTMMRKVKGSDKYISVSYTRGTRTDKQMRMSTYLGSHSVLASGFEEREQVRCLYGCFDPGLVGPNP